MDEQLQMCDGLYAVGQELAAAMNDMCGTALDGIAQQNVYACASANKHVER